MQIILIKEVDNLGEANDVVEVKPGYGRNYLIPQGFAKIANTRNLAQLDKIIQKQEADAAKKLSESKAMAEKLDGVILKIGAKAGTSGKIFGSVTSVQIIAAIRDQIGLEIERKAVNLLEDVKELGSYAAEINLHPEVTAKVNFEVTEDK